MIMEVYRFTHKHKIRKYDNFLMYISHPTSPFSCSLICSLIPHVLVLVDSQLSVSAP